MTKLTNCSIIASSRRRGGGGRGLRGACACTQRRPHQLFLPQTPPTAQTRLNSPTQPDPTPAASYSPEFRPGGLRSARQPSGPGDPEPGMLAASRRARTAGREAGGRGSLPGGGGGVRWGNGAGGARRLGRDGMALRSSKRSVAWEM